MSDRKRVSQPPERATGASTGTDARIATAPITWGVCEVPGWGVQLPSDHVLAEMRSVGFAATEAGAAGFLPEDARALAEVLGGYALRLVGGFVPVVLHDPAALGDTLAHVRRQARRFAGAGGTVLVSALVADEAWTRRNPLDGAEWRRVRDGLKLVDDLCAEQGLDHVVHPHVGTLVETADDVARLVEASDVGLCIDTGHLEIGGVDTVTLVRDVPSRVRHVHLKDVRAAIAAQVREGALDLLRATRLGLFAPVGDGDAPVTEVLAELGAAGYAGWLVLEQDTVVESAAVAGRPTDDARRSFEVVRRLTARRDLAGHGAGGR